LLRMRPIKISIAFTPRLARDLARDETGRR